MGGRRSAPPSPSLRLVRRGLLRLLRAVADPRADHVGLAAPAHLLGHPLPGALEEPGLLRGGHHVRADRGPAGRQLGQRGHLQVAEHGHGDRARDRRGGHHQHVRPSLAGLVAQHVALLHAEPVLFVDHHQAQLGELDLLLQQRVRADDQPGRAGRGVQQGPPPGRRPQRPGEQRDPGRLLGAAQLAGLAERAEQPADRPVVLLGEHLGGGQQHGLPAAVHGLQHGPHRDDRLARAHLALQQPVHRVVEGQLIGDRLAGLPLALGQLERQPGVELVQQAAGLARPRHRRVRGGLLAAQRQHDLEHERLVPLQPGGGPPGVGPVGRAVDPAQRVGQPGQAVPVPQGRGQRVLRVVKRVQREPHRVGDLPGGDVLAGRVDRDQLGRELGRAGPGLAGAQQLELRVGELPPSLEGGHLPGEQPADAGPEQLLPPVLAAAAEEGQRQPPAAVGDHRLQDRARPVPHLAHRHRRDLGLHGHVLAVGQRGQLGQLAPGVVPARVVPQQVAYRAQAEGRLQPLGRLGAHHRPERIGQARHRVLSPPCLSALCLVSTVPGLCGRPTVRPAAVSAGRPARANPPRSVILPRPVRARPGPRTYFTST